MVDKRIPVTDTTQAILKELTRGSRFIYEDVIRHLLSEYLAPGEDPLLAGRRLREEFLERFGPDDLAFKSHQPKKEAKGKKKK